MEKKGKFYTTKEIQNLIQSCEDFMKKKKFTNALQVLKPAIDNSQHPIFYLQRSKVFCSMQKFHLALKDALTALSKVPCGECYLRLAKVFEGLGKITECKEAIKDGLDVEPKHLGLLKYKRNFLPTELTERQIIELKQVFQLFDKNFSGAIEPYEIYKIMKDLGTVLTKKELLKIVNHFDLNADGTIDFAEFLTILKEELDSNSVQNEIKQAFKVLDKDGNGKLSLSEMKNGFLTLCEHDLSENLEKMYESLGLKELEYVDFVRCLMIDFSKSKTTKIKKVKVEKFK